VLIQLLEILSGKEVRRYTKQTRSAFQKLDNINVALDFLSHEMNLRVLGCNPQGIRLSLSLSLSLSLQLFCV
jgi:hypothetical protein